MDINKMKVFLSVAELGSLSKAAERFGYTQAGVAYIINKMEDELKIQLIERKYNGVSLTVAGRSLLAEFQRMVNAYDGFEAAVFARRLESKSALHVASIESAAKRWLGRAVLKVREMYPDVFIDIIIADSYEIKRGIENGSYDIGVIEDVVPVDSLAWRKLEDDPYFAVMSKAKNCDAPCRLKDLDGPVFFVGEYGEDRTSLHAIRKEGLGGRIASDRIGTELILLACGSGYGVSMISALQYLNANAELPSKAVPKLVKMEEGVQRTIGLIANKENGTNPLYRDFADTCIDVAHKDILWHQIKESLILEPKSASW
ncbi:MAG: LysR family transcriptional regulator [Firmicutes bacterium]|nr:LysR family transcriptional regulator [Bacillota bacterium]